MKKLIFILALALSAPRASAQWAVIDPANIATSISNMARNVVQTSATAANMVKTFNETCKIYEQSKRYYDALKGVSDMVRGARRVKETILVVSDISDIYVTNFQRMLTDTNYSPEELSAIGAGYGKLLQQSANSLLDLKVAISPTGLSMSDRERMEMVEAVHSEVLRLRRLTDYYTRKSISVSVVRARERGDLQRVVQLYGANQRYW